MAPYASSTLTGTVQFTQYADKQLENVAKTTTPKIKYGRSKVEYQ